MQLETPIALDLSEPPESTSPTQPFAEPDESPDGGKTYKDGPGCELAADQFEVALNLHRTLKEAKDGDLRIVSITKNLTNLITILRLDPEYGPDLKMSEMGQRIYHHDVEVNTDTFVSMVRDYITRHYLGVDFSRENTKDAITVVASENRFHPVRDFLHQLPAWDGQARLDRVPSWILKTEDQPLYEVFFRKTMISMVARVMKPGCDVHTILVLAGPQGTLKSTFMKTLAMNPDWFSCSKLDIKDKDGRLNLHYVWITELAEIDKVINRVGDDSIMKEFITDPRDLYRAPYAPAPKMHDRSSVMVGTTNEPEFLRDKTGSRRYWPMTIRGKIDIEAMIAVREQLWAEAFNRYNQGETWWLTDEEESIREQNAKGYEVEDPLEDFLRDALRDLSLDLNVGASLKDMIERLPLEYRKVQPNRLSHILKRFGWEKRSVRLGGNRFNRWFAPEGWCLAPIQATGPVSHNPFQEALAVGVLR
jgi:predicted P-loop ATPase